MQRICAIFFTAALILAGPVRAADTGVLVFAASSLTDALTEVGEAYAATGKARPVLSFASSAVLARQIENGAPAEVFVSADEQWMDYLAERKLIVPASRVSFLGNSLVLVAPAANPFKIAIAPDFPLAKALNGGKLALGDPDSVPAGRYGKAALENLGVWRDVEASVVRAENVRAALTFVARGEAAAGIVYSTDAAAEKNVVVAANFPPSSYPPVSYPVAVTAARDTPAGRDFRAFMLSDAAKAIYAKYGFAVK